MYVFDTNVFITLGHYYRSRFPTVWSRVDSLADSGELVSVREVKRELDQRCSSEDVLQWMRTHSKIYRKPNGNEELIVAQIFENPQYRGFVRRDSLLKGLPVADPFIVAAAEADDGIVVTQESLKQGGARIPTVCQERDVKCINLEVFLEYEDLKY